MSIEEIVRSKGMLEEIRTALRRAPLVALRELLPDRQILDACRACGHTFRRRRYGPVVTVLHFLAQALQRDSSFAATWQELWTPVVADFPELAREGSKHSALTHARGRLPTAVLEDLVARASRRGAALEGRLWRGFRLRALDVTTISMPREPELFDYFGVHRARSTTVRYPLASFACLLDVAGSLIVDHRFGPFDPGEMATATPLLEELTESDLLLADRRFSGTPFLWAIRATGAQFLMRKNARLIVERLPVVKKLGTHDFITEIPVSASTRKCHPDMPASVRTRIFKATWRTPAREKVTEWFVTSLEDTKRFPKRTLALLYHRRWQEETSYREFKDIFHSDILRSKTVANVRKEFAAHVLAYQLTRLVIAEAARQHHKKPTRISPLAAARWIMAFSRRMTVAPAWQLPSLYQLLLDVVASDEIDVRPGRLEPRAVTRERKHYPRLKITRHLWRTKRLEKTP